MNSINTDEMNWAEQLMVFKSVCRNRHSWCSNCPNCAHFDMKTPEEKEKEDKYYFEFKEMLGRIKKYED